MADMTRPAALRTGEAAHYRHNPTVLRWMAGRKFHNQTHVLTDQEYAAAIADPINLQFARVVTCNPNGLPDPKLRSH